MTINKYKTKKTVIFNPVLDPTNPYSTTSNLPPEARSRPVRFSRPVKRPNPKARSNVITTPEIQGAFVVPGVNNLSDEDWDFIAKHPVGQRFVSSGAFVVIAPTLAEGQEATGLTVDYALPDALNIIRNIMDVDWLKRSDRKDGRAEISEAIDRRLKELEKQNLQNRAIGSGAYG